MVHPRHHEGFDWDEENEEHLASHGIYAYEVEQAYWNGATWAKDHGDQSGDYFMFGKTDGGRRITVVIEFIEVTRRLRAFTGWDSTTGERTKYFNE